MQNLELENKIIEIDNKINELIKEKHKTQKKIIENSLPEIKEKYENKFFVYKNNSYSIPSKKSDYWNVYFKVIEITEDAQIKAFRIELTSTGVVHSNIETLPYDWKYLEEITREEYTNAMNKIFYELEKRHK